MINYPLLLPPSPNFSAMKLRMQNIVAVNRSPFTAQQQTYLYPGEWWEADVALPPIGCRQQAELWLSFLASLRGQYGTFLLGDPLGRSPGGAAKGSPLMPPAALLSQAQSNTLTVAGWDPNVPDILLPGDYIEIGRNFLLAPNDFSNVAWAGTSSGGPIPVAGAAANAPYGAGAGMADGLTFPAVAPGQFAQWQQFVAPDSLPLLVAGQQFTFGVWLRAQNAPGAQISIGLRSGSGSIFIGEDALLNLTPAWGYYQVSGTISAAQVGFNVGVVIYNANNQPAQAIYAWGVSLDDGVSRRRLHKVLTEADTDANGLATFDIFPVLRETPDEAAPISVQGARGMFRLAENTREFSLDNAGLYGIQFKAVEAF